MTMQDPAVDQAAANSAAYRRRLEDGPNRRDLAAIDDLVAPDFIGHWLFNAPPLEGRDAFRRWLTTSITAFPDWCMSLDLGSRSMVRAGSRGSQRRYGASAQLLALT